MATTSPDNLWTPDAGDPYALTIDLAATADTIQDALTALRSSTGAGGIPQLMPLWLPDGTNPATLPTGIQRSYYIHGTGGTPSWYPGGVVGNYIYDVKPFAPNNPNVVQVATERAGNRRWTRYSSNSGATWSAWETQAATQAEANAGTRADVFVTPATIPSRLAAENRITTVPVNCNTLTDTGWYSASSWTNMPSGANTIAAMEVVRYSGDWILQRFTVISATNLAYQRAYYSGTTWSAWRTL